jgi:predicted neuraminidase
VRARWVWGVWVVAGMLVAALVAAKSLPPWPAFVRPATLAANGLAEAGTDWLPVTSPSVHAVTLVVERDGSLLAAWFGGTREGARDVKIHFAKRQGGRWGEARVIASPESIRAATGRYVRKLGNPMLHRDREGRLHLLYVTTAFGGWACAMLHHQVSADGGATWSRPERLVMSPFLNISTLVRAPALDLADGGFMVPAYFEFLWKNPLWLRFDAAGRFVERRAPASPRDLLQPALAVDGERGDAYLRDGGTGRRSVWRMTTADGGRSWTWPAPLPLANPNAGVAVLRAEQGVWMVANPVQRGRGRLELLKSADGSTFAPLSILENEQEPGREFSYPALAVAPDGTVHLAYTWDRTRLKHRWFRPAEGAAR